MKVNPLPVAVLTSGMPYKARRDAHLALLEVTALPPKQAEMTKEYLADIHKHSKLRNWIAHSYWTWGSREGSVKPVQMRTLQGDLKFVGLEDDERDYTLAELKAAGLDAQAKCDCFAEFIKASWPGSFDTPAGSFNFGF